MKAIIVGGGIGGLTAAIALGRAGIEAEVYERAPELREVGAGVSLWANAIISLDALGVGGAIRRLGLNGGEGGVRKSSGALITSTSYDRLVKQYGAAIVVIHRADLLNLLGEHLQLHQLHLGHDCVGFKQDGAGVRAQFANGKAAEGDVLIGADGIRSVIRSQLFGPAAPKYCGYTAWRCVTNLKGTEVPSGESWGAGRRFGIVPLGGDRVYWYATNNEPAGGSDATKEALLKLFRGWHEPIEALIEAAEDGSIIRNDIYDRDPLPHWSVGRATLLGDSAHPMSPNLGQGACQAIEDAVELAVSLRNSDSVEAGLTAYERRRVERTGKIVLQARRIGQLGQWQNPAACMLRDFLLKMTPRSVAENQLEWVVGYDPLSAEERAVLSKA